MRLWHYQLLPYLPELQFKGQLRELVAIMHDWRDKGATNNILINRVTRYPKGDLVRYFIYYEALNHKRYGKWLPKQWEEFKSFADTQSERDCEIGVFNSWHNKEYLRVCMANLYEKHTFGKGKSRISDNEWQVLLDGYKKITGEDYKI